MLVDRHMCQHRSSFTKVHGEGRGTWGEAWGGEARRYWCVWGLPSSCLCTQRNWDDGCWCCVCLAGQESRLLTDLG